MLILLPLVALTAGFLGWVLARRMLIRPLVALRRELASYRPGTILQPASTQSQGATHEIAELGEAFHALSRDIARHDEEMRQSLERQKQLTREVHHRVKNNLQIISSLISLHWRAADDPLTAGAYLSIQRRVDALAVVQRNHYAELEEQKGVRARAILNEIVAGLRTSTQVQGDHMLDIQLLCDDLCLHLDVAAPVAFMVAELADLIIGLGAKEPLRLTLSAVEDTPGYAQFALQSPLFCQDRLAGLRKMELCERVLNGLARQLRTPLDHDVAEGRYTLIIPYLD